MKRQTKYKGCLLALACLLAAGCSQEDALPAKEDGARVPLTITSASMETEVSVTRAGTTPLGAGATIGVFLDNAVGVTSYGRMQNTRYNCGGAAWNPSSEANRIYLTSDKAVVCAYYPHKTNLNISVADRSVKMNLDPYVLADGEEPFAYATSAEVNAESKEVSFSMKQACSWLVIDFKRGDVKDDITLSSFSLSNANLVGRIELDIMNGTESYSSKQATLEFTGDIALPKKGAVKRGVAMLPSASLTGGLKVSVKVKEYGDKVMSTTLTGLTALQRGYKYGVTLTVNGTNIEATSVEVLPWTQVTVNNGGIEYIPLP